MSERILALWIAALLKLSAVAMAVDGLCYRLIDDAAADLTRRRWARRTRGRKG